MAIFVHYYHMKTMYGANFHLNFRKRKPKEQWWLKLRPLLRILAKHQEGPYRADAIISKFDLEDDDNE